MKRTIIGILAVLVVALVSCEKTFDELEISPNQPTDVSPAVLLTNCEVSTFIAYGGNASRITSIWMNQGAGTDFQLIDAGNYNYTANDVVNDWDNIYANNLVNLQELINKTEGTSPHYSGAAKVLMAMGYGVATDLWGDIPFSEALQGQQGQFSAAYDPQEQVIIGIQSLLDEAIVELGAAESALSPGSDDLIYGGDLGLWIKAAYAMKARYAMRLTKRQGNSAASAALSALGSAFAANGENMMAVYGTANNNANQWYAFQTNRGGYYSARQSFVDMLSTDYGVEDPRLKVYFTVNDDGDVVGAVGGGPAPAASIVADFFAAINAPLPLITFFEMKFIEAEANEMVNGNGKAELEEAMAASFEFCGVDGSAYIAGALADYDAADADGKMEIIMKEKYKAMFTQVEVFADWRRTGFPELTPQPGAVLTQIPRRFPTSQNEILYNTAVKQVTNLNSPVWWDE
jgi:hypothetical protein